MKSNIALSVAQQAARAAGKLLMASYGKLKSSQIRTKSKNDFVTELDKKSEDLIIGIIKKSFPGHSFQAEEGGASSDNTQSQARWIIDPLDGTANYIRQFPLFSVSIALYDKGALQCGVVFDPVHDEMFSAEIGKGAALNGKKIKVSEVRVLADAMMATGFPFRARGRFEEYMTTFKAAALASQGMRRGGSAALDLAYVACGRFDGFWEINLSPWDIAAGALLIREAGGKVTDMWGRGDYLKNGDILASNSAIHAELQDITSKTLTPKN